MMFEVEIRVGGEVDPSWIRDRMPGFTVARGPSVAIIRGSLGPDENMASILGALYRHGVEPFDVWVDTFGVDR
ncbi:hypothetical protein [Nakamurella multipartita]|uniref:Uncharacterized protein n=1 Tax=Nakamurella multipartita (strain ATCC 700099 / DSM 44233 / CIP 104796 / JCM 9543 / NBRC 105858 / Y-104) TaxID=479431 RepID=C8XCB0_NAKMY|nr:hypothetical protein [Nakamurella multipartita]ACV81504.1 hypothetical protein Namu_5238 [Nakamurella multipartita DSM 44233]